MYKNFIAIIFCLMTCMFKTQTLIEFDRMETSSPLYLSAGWWTPAATAGWFTNASVTPTTSAAIYGLGSGTSTIEQDWYVLPNVTGLNSTHQYQLKFRLASYTFSNTTATTRGVDVADYVDVQVSTNGEISYTSELRITGNSNAQWPYTSTGTITHTANGTYTNSAAPIGDIYQAPAGITTTGPSTITLNLPIGITQVAIDILCRINSAGEEWWIDNIELWDISPIGLPVELIYFEGTEYSNTNLLKWATATEYNSDYFVIEESIDGIDWKYLTSVQSAGNSTNQINYSYIDYQCNALSYYRLLQYDLDGVYKTYGPISIYHAVTDKTVVKYLNMLGQEVSSDTKGLIIIVYDDGTSEKTIK